MARIVISDVFKKHFTLVGYLLVSGGLGYVLAAYVAGNPALTAIFAPAINYVIYAVKKELDKEGIVEALRK